MFNYIYIAYLDFSDILRYNKDVRAREIGEQNLKIFL